MNSLHLVPHALVVVLLVAAAAIDIRSFRIPNLICGAILALWPLAWILGGPTPSLSEAAVALVIVVVVLGLQWHIGHRVRWMRFGGGDWKLLSALAPWAGIWGLGDLLLATALAGGLETLALVAARLAVPEHSWLRDHAWTGPALAASGIPYGVAIALGGGVVILAAIGGLTG